MTPFVFCAEERNIIGLSADGFLARGVYLAECREQALTGMANQADKRFFGGVRAERIRVTDLGMRAFVGKVSINLAQDFVKERAMLMLNDPQLKAFEGGVIRSEGIDRIANEPLDDDAEGGVDLKFEFAQRPIEEVTDEEGANELCDGVGGGCAGTGTVMKVGAGGSEGGVSKWSLSWMSR